MKFKLLFLKKGILTRGPEAYVCAQPTGGYTTPDPRAGHILLTSECTTERECHAQIDELIDDLQRLKAEVSARYRAERHQPVIQSMLTQEQLDAMAQRQNESA